MRISWPCSRSASMSSTLAPGREPVRRTAGGSRSRARARSRSSASFDRATLAEAAARLREIGHDPTCAARWRDGGLRVPDPVRSARPRRCMRQPGSAVTSASAADGAGELVVGHRHRDLRLADGERPAEAAAEVGARERHERRARGLQEPPRLRLRPAARAACGRSRGTRPAGPRSVEAAARRPLRRGRPTAPTRRTARTRAARAGSARASSRTSPTGRRRGASREKERDERAGDAARGGRGGPS